MSFLPFTRPSIDEETIAGVAEVLRSGWITTGPQCKQFETELSALCDGRPVVSLNSGTAALELALRIADIGPGDEVITTALSWVATANVILTVGARPVFVDIDPRTRNQDLNQLAQALTPRTRALIPVYLAGLPMDLEKLYRFAAQHRLRVVEDAAQAFGSTWQGRPIGTIGDMAAFSFHANKNMTTGEGGALVLPDEASAQRARVLRLQGVVRSGEDGMEVEELGFKWNLTDVAARIGIGQLRRLPEFTARRRALAQRYFQLFKREEMAALGCELPLEDFQNSNWHMFQIVLPAAASRSEFIAAMRAADIGIGVHYPAIHLFKLYRELGWKEGDCPQAERVGRSIVSLPLFPAMRDEDVDRVCASLLQILSPAKA
jgi:dTDP-4-amino-4,6-dideoxygalactose transaminase